MKKEKNTTLQHFDLILSLVILLKYKDTYLMDLLVLMEKEELETFSSTKPL